MGINVVLQQTTIIPDIDSDFPFSIQCVWKILPEFLICQGFYSFLCSVPNVDERENLFAQKTLYECTL